MRNDFYRYLSWRIQTANLARKVVHRFEKFDNTTFTEESWKPIEKFVKFAVEIYNESHLNQPTTTDHALKILKKWWKYDYLECLSEPVILE